MGVTRKRRESTKDYEEQKGSAMRRCASRKLKRKGPQRRRAIAQLHEGGKQRQNIRGGSRRASAHDRERSREATFSI